MRRYVIVGALMVCGSILMSGCNSDDDTKKSVVAAAATGVIVDPYIDGAVLCEDVNKNDSCDSGEQLSSASNSEGEFTFSEELSAGSHIIIKTQGKHNGKTYDLNISGVVDTDGNIEVVSPLTTLQARGLSASQIESLLTEVGLDNFSSAFLLGDPMSGGLKDKKLSELTAADLANLQASLATYGLLRVMDGSTTLRSLTGTELYAAIQSGGAVHEILSVMVSNIQLALSLANMTVLDNTVAAMQAGAQSGGSPVAIPDLTLETVIKTAVAILDRLTTIGYSTCNATSGTDTQKVTAALNAVNTNASAVIANAAKLGQMFYGQINTSTLYVIKDWLGAVPDVVAGIESTGDTFVINSNNSVETYSE